MIIPTTDQHEDTDEQRFAWIRVRNAETSYSRRLRRLADQIFEMIRTLGIDNPHTQFLLEQYGRLIRPWAEAVAARFVAEVSRRDERAWEHYGRRIARGLFRDITQAPIGPAMQRELERQVALITALPGDVSQRIQRDQLEQVHGELISQGGAFYESARAESMVERIQAIGNFTHNRAMTIARTETARVASTLMQVRAQHIGSDSYIWRNVGDWKVRPALGSPHFAELNTLERGSHRKLGGTVHRWDNPPIAGTRGERAHPGQIYNCRCFAEPILPDQYVMRAA